VARELTIKAKRSAVTAALDSQPGLKAITGRRRNNSLFFSYLSK
jgi:hypothetical protein